MANNQNNRNSQINNAIKKSVQKQTRKATKKAMKKYPIVFVLIILLAFAMYLGASAIEYNNINLGFDLSLETVDFSDYVGFDVDFRDINLFEYLFPKKIESVPVPADGEAIFHFIDVGQGDAILITTKGGNILVDTSEPSAKEQLDEYLKFANITELEYLVLTHPDSDHIGNAEHIIRNYNVKTVVMSEFVGTTKTYERVLDAIEEKKCSVIIGEAGNSFVLEGLKCVFLGPVEDYNDPNEMSLVIKAMYGDTSVMLTGDAEVESEGDILKKWNKETLKCDILKVGHHGSTTSTTQAFLDAVDPDIAVISCGDGNKYGHPHTETINKLNGKRITTWRTDKDGTIIYKTDGEKFVLVDNG